MTAAGSLAESDATEDEPQPASARPLPAASAVAASAKGWGHRPDGAGGEADLVDLPWPFSPALQVGDGDL